MTERVADRAFLSIGEVLSLLKEEFPDITISKIRFLESQGLLDPERTASGYRKFYETDVERLRWILRQQREHFLPLKVIKGRLVGEEAEPEPDLRQEGPGIRPQTAGDRPAAATAAAAKRSSLTAGPSGVNLTLEELSAASGLAPEKLHELERYGFIAGRPVAGTVYYDEESMVVANLAGAFLGFGIEARHLRPYKNAADREAALFEQIVTPLIKQRNPQARRQAVETLGELTSMGERLRAALVRQALRSLSGG